MQPFAAYNHPQRPHLALRPLLTFIPPPSDVCMYQNNINEILLDEPRFCQCFVPLLSDMITGIRVIRYRVGNVIRFTYPYFHLHNHLMILGRSAAQDVCLS